MIAGGEEARLPLDQMSRVTRVARYDSDVPREPKIVQVEISSIPRPKPHGLFDPTPVVTATFDDGSRKRLFSFYPDEIRFDEGDLVGLTEAEAHSLRHERDVRFLRAP